MMYTLLLIAAIATVAQAKHHDVSSSDRSTEASLNKARVEANRLIFEAERLLEAGKLHSADDLQSGGLPVLQRSKHHDSSSSSSSSSSSGLSSTTLSTSDRIHIAVEERLIEQAIEDALHGAAATQAPVRKQAYQARYEISQYAADDFNTDAELNYGPTVISTRSNFFLQGYRKQSYDTQYQYTTAGDYLDLDQNGEPEMVTALTAFRDTADPSEYLRVMRNRAVGADPKTGTINLINLIRLDGVFSQTNQLLSPCFSATNQDEFVFETFVGVQPGQEGVLTAKPEQTTSILLSGSTAVHMEDGAVSPRDHHNIFWDADAGSFVKVAEIPLWINLWPDLLIPGADDIRRQGTVYFTECSQFNYFQ